MMAAGTPDYQYGVVTPQVKLAQVAGGTNTTRVAIPPNAETLIVTAAGFATPPTVTCQGVTTAYKYSGSQAVPQRKIASSLTWAFDVSNALDDQVDISFSVVPGTGWYVYADAGTRVVVDASKLTDLVGQQYVTSTIPSPLSGDHPAYELQVTNNTFVASGALIAAPGVGFRIRLFSLQMSCSAAGMLGLLANAGGGTTYLAVYGVGSCPTSIPAQGVPMPENTGLSYFLAAGAGSASVCAYFSTEAI